MAYDAVPLNARPVDEMSPEQQLMNATERFQTVLAGLAKAGVKADDLRRQATMANAELDDAHRAVDDAEQEFRATIDRLGLAANYPRPVGR